MSYSKKSSSHPLLSKQAVAVAREALVELGDGSVGRHIGVTGVGHHVATHRFEAHVPGYSGWEWNAVVAVASGETKVTVNEVALVPADDALKAPEWVPYSQRLRAGDLGPGDLMPPEPDDPRLTEGESSHAVVVGLKRHHYLTTQGLEDAKQRWRSGDYGPTSVFAEKASMTCRSCAFYVPLGEPIGENFGVCVNEYSADGIVVHATYGCGAHSETTVDSPNTAHAFDDEKPIF